MSHVHHPHPIAFSPSVLRASVGKRLAAVAVVLAMLWGAIFWAMG